MPQRTNRFSWGIVLLVCALHYALPATAQQTDDCPVVNGYYFRSRADIDGFDLVCRYAELNTEVTDIAAECSRDTRCLSFILHNVMGTDGGLRYCLKTVADYSAGVRLTVFTNSTALPSPCHGMYMKHQAQNTPEGCKSVAGFYYKPMSDIPGYDIGCRYSMSSLSIPDIAAECRANPSCLSFVVARDIPTNYKYCLKTAADYTSGAKVFTYTSNAAFTSPCFGIYIRAQAPVTQENCPAVMGFNFWQFLDMPLREFTCRSMIASNVVTVAEECRANPGCLAFNRDFAAQHQCMKTTASHIRPWHSRSQACSGIYTRTQPQLTQDGCPAAAGFYYKPQADLFANDIVCSAAGSKSFVDIAAECRLNSRCLAFNIYHNNGRQYCLKSVADYTPGARLINFGLAPQWPTLCQGIYIRTR